jgi:hypothetical protein
LAAARLHPAQRRRLADAELIDDLPVLVALVVDRPPPDLAPRQRRAERPILASGAGDRGEEPTAVLMHVRHVLGGRRLVAGEVEEVATLGQRAEQVPGGAVGLVVGRVAALGLEIDRDPAVTALLSRIKCILNYQSHLNQTYL